MLWKICLKRFRWFIYCLILAVLFALPAASDGESGGAFGAIAFLIFVPAAFVAFVWAAYAAVRDIINVHKGGALPEEWVNYICGETLATVGEVASPDTTVTVEGEGKENITIAIVKQ